MSASDRRIDKLAAFRLDDNTISAGCRACPLLNQCGGYTRAGGGWSCMDRCSSCNESCDRVCLKKPTDFARALLEVGGFDHRDIPRLGQTPERLPAYVPVIQHGFEQEVSVEWAAFPLPAVMRFTGGRYVPIAATGSELRARMGVSLNTKVIILATGKDRPIESYWRWRRLHGAPQALARLGVSAAIAPNYSMFLEDPRPQHMFNRKRSLLCAAEWSTSGIDVVPYLQAVTPADWRYWEVFLREHEEITYVAKEFQTGLASPERGREAIERLSGLQDTIGRRMHLIAVGGARFRKLISERFDLWTLMDSAPFMKAVKRRIASRVDAHRVTWKRALNSEVGGLFFHNVARYQEWLGGPRGRMAANRETRGSVEVATSDEARETHG